MREELIEAERRKAVLKDWGKTALEIAKWALVIWLLWPLRSALGGSVNFTRVVVGIVLFIIFAGKVFYDTVIMGVIRQRRTSVKQDILTLIGIVSVVSLVVGLMLVLVGFMIVELIQTANQPEEE